VDIGTNDAELQRRWAKPPVRSATAIAFHGNLVDIGARIFSAQVHLWFDCDHIVVLVRESDWKPARGSANFLGWL
jgi:hypothetical protein